MRTLFVVSGNGLKNEFWDKHFEALDIDQICMFSSISLCAKNLHKAPVAVIVDDYFSKEKHEDDQFQQLLNEGTAIIHLSPAHAVAAPMDSPVLKRNFSTELIGDVEKLITGNAS